MYAGLRRGEALALIKKDIDFKEGIIAVNKTVIFEGNKPSLKGTPKTKSGNRKIPMPQTLYNTLKTYIKGQSELFIFSMEDGSLMTLSALNRMWESFETKINIAAGGKNGKKKI